MNINERLFQDCSLILQEKLYRDGRGYNQIPVPRLMVQPFHKWHRKWAIDNPTSTCASNFLLLVHFSTNSRPTRSSMSSYEAEWHVRQLAVKNGQSRTRDGLRDHIFQGIPTKQSSLSTQFPGKPTAKPGSRPRSLTSNTP